MHLAMGEGVVALAPRFTRAALWELDQDLDRLEVVHGAITIGYAFEICQLIEDAARLDRPV